MKQLSVILPSLRGVKGRDISLGVNLTHIQKKYVETDTWENLVAFNSFAPNAIRKTGGVFLGNTQFKTLVAQISYPSVADNTVGINLSFASYFWLDLTDDVNSFEIINVPNNVATFTLIVNQNASTVYTLDFNFTGSTLKWAGNNPPEYPVDNLNQIDMYTFSTKNQGVSWFAKTIGLDFKSL